MTFVNGFPENGSIKLPLYLVEPEQLSDLVAVPRSNVEYWNIRLITYENNSDEESDRDIQEVSFPIENIPCLFQRYNPDGLSFADGYSTKLYEWKRKYSHLTLARTNKLLNVITFLNSEPLVHSFNIGNTLKIKLPNNNKKIELTYYFAELTPYPLLVASSFQDFTNLEPEDIAQWRTAVTPNGKKPNSRKSAYLFRRIDNDCIKVPRTRSWLLRSEIHFCRGQEIELDDDILIASLVLNLYDFTPEETDAIKGQIPEFYFYDYLDTFFSIVDELILESNPNIFNLQQATKVKYTVNIDYEIDHYQNSIEEIRPKPPFQRNGITYNRQSSLHYERDPESKYFIKASTSYSPEVEYLDYVKISDVFKFGTIVYANNNNWDNYSFNLEDRGYVHLDRGDKLEYRDPSNLVTFNFLGNHDRRDSSQKYIYLALDPTVESRTYNLIDTFYGGSKNFAQDSYVDAFCLEKQMPDRSPEIHNDYFTRLLYDSCVDFPSIDLKLGNFLKARAYSVASEDVSNNFYLRYEVTKLFLCQFNVLLTSWNYQNSYLENTNQIRASYTVENSQTTIELGELDFTFNKYDEPHPTSIKVDSSTEPWSYEPNKYFPGTGINFAVEPENFKLVEGNYEILSEKQSGKNLIGKINNSLTIKLDRYSLDRDTSFQQDGLISQEFTATLIPATQLKPLRKYDFEAEAFDFIYQAHQECYMANCDLEDLKKQVREIHLALYAQKYAYEDGTEDVSRVANLGYYIERISRVLGISVNSNGSIRSIRQSKLVEPSQSVPAGWNLGQWGRNNGGSSQGQTGGNSKEERDGLAMEIRSNQFTNDDFTGETNRIEEGGYALVENLPQMLHILMTDLDRALGLQDAGANVLPSPNGDKVASYQGMNQMMLDILYTLGQISKQTSSTNILAMKNQAMIQELMAGYGLPVQINEMEINTALGGIGKIPFPAFAPNAPTLNDLHALTNLNLAAVIGSKLQVKSDGEEEEIEGADSTTNTDDEEETP